MRIASIAAIHANLPALEAVLIDIARRQIDRTINLGDCVSGPRWPREVCKLLTARHDPTIRGNHDRWVSGPDPARIGASDRYAYSQLNQDHRSWLAALIFRFPGENCGSLRVIELHARLRWAATT